MEDWELVEASSKRREMASDATIRDYFAAKAMAAIVNGAIAVGQGFNSHDESEKLAGAAYRIADAMIDFRGQ